jgi:hypothetical protein
VGRTYRLDEVIDEELLKVVMKNKEKVELKNWATLVQFDNNKLATSAFL